MSSGKLHATATISLLTLQRVLSGEISQEEFRRDHGAIAEQIERHSRAGLGITKIEIERCPDRDDDWVVLEFGAPAPDRLFEKRGAGSTSRPPSR